MKLAWKELKYNWKKYLLVETIVILMMFMVLFLSGLVKGLGSAVSSGIENINAKTFIVSEDAEKLLTVSSLSPDEFALIKENYGEKAALLNVQRMYLQKEVDGDKLDIAYFAIEAESFLNPEVYKGEKLNTDVGTIVLDDAYEGEGIQVGDSVFDSASGVSMKVVGFTKNAMYGHISVGYISLKTYSSIMEKINPFYQETARAAVIQGEQIQAIDNTKAYSKSEIVEAIPGYKAEQMTITMVEWLLVVITALIIGIFFFVINLQKEKEFGVLKAIGTSMGSLVQMILTQVFFIALSGALLSAVLVSILSAMLPAKMPFALLGSQVALVLISFVLISILGSLATVFRVAQIDPARIIGGDFQ